MFDRKDKKTTMGYVFPPLDKPCSEKAPEIVPILKQHQNKPAIKEQDRKKTRREAVRKEQWISRFSEHIRESFSRKLFQYCLFGIIMNICKGRFDPERLFIERRPLFIAADLRLSNSHVLCQLSVNPASVHSSSSMVSAA